VTDGGVGRRHRIEAIDFVDLIAERAAHYQPHHHLDAFGAGLAHVIDMRNLDELLRILLQVVEERLVPFAVDQAGARAADLMR
jgi:hydrogenase/urease accessory protein HupE